MKDRPLQKPVKIHGQSIEALLKNLEHPVNGVRQRTRVELSARDSKEVIAATQKWAANFDPNDETEAHHLLEALWMHQQHNVKNEELLNTLLASEVPHAAHAAKTVHHFWYNVDTTGASGFAAPPESDVVKYKTPRHLARADHKAYELGAKVFQRHSHCATCHLTHGEGNGLIYPSLVGSPWVTGSEDRLIKMALHGMWGKITVHGKTYDPSRGVPPMTAFRNLLKDDEIAAVLTFVRNTWGNKASPVSAESVKRVRAETINRTTFWKPEDLLAEHPLEPELMVKGAEEAETFSNDELEKELLAASPGELAQTALEKGNFRRGKTLFYNSAAGCFACHDPPAGVNRIGPDLTKIKSVLTPEELVESILHPSKRIDKEFAQVSVVTVDGKQHTGIRVSDSENEIVLRSLAQPEPLTLKKDDIDEIFDSKISIMPAGLSKQFKSRREFNDLLKYIMEVRKR